MSVFGDGSLSTHADPTHGQRAGRIGKHTGHAYDQTPYELHTCIYSILGYGGAKFPKVGDSLPRSPMNHHTKFDAASFILIGEIRNRTNKQNYKH